MQQNLASTDWYDSLLSQYIYVFKKKTPYSNVCWRL